MDRDFLRRLPVRAMRCGSLLLCLACAPAQAGTQTLAYETQALTVDGERRTARVPRGYRLEWLAGMDSPRMLAFAANGDLFAGSKSGKVYRLPPPYKKPEVLVELGDYPHSVAFRPGEILIARTDGVYRAPYRPGQSKISPEALTLLAALPAGGGHDSRTAGVGPDGRVYASLGIQRNCSDQYLGAGYPFDERRGGVLVLREGAGKASWEPYASGLRNPVGFDWHPQTGALYASNNGPDHLGYDRPPEYFSKLDAGSFHGMPWFQFDGKQVKRDDCVASSPPRPINQVMLPAATFPSRNAPLGMAFVPKGAMDARLEFDAAVALHGSWGTQPGGGFIGRPSTRRPPKLVAVRFQNGQAVRVDDLVTGFQLPDGERWARPAGVAFGPDGALYFSSDSDANGLFRLKRLR
ncbi:MAG: PQQ-dependent sugar dehydrogenase [Gallionella sp.]|jgi:glucose/arabinose dehydrogenase|nr:PQQ-dependent sugar dehydrogenase [Gallionella sp.]MCK9354185.1 PQQ-dependent sugar dehydrogenase [Gallionella sp.]